MLQSQYFHVKGMTCAGCEKTIQGAVNDLKDVERCSASHQWNLLELQVDGQLTTEKLSQLKETVVSQVTDFGFKIEPLDNIDKLFSQDDKHQPKLNSFYSKALSNVILGAAWYGLKPWLLTLSLPLGLMCHGLVLGMMLATAGSFYKDAWQKLKAKKWSMNSLIAISTLTAWCASTLALFIPAVFGVSFAFMPIFMILGITNIGRAVRAYQESKAQVMMQQQDALFKKHQPSQAYLVKDWGKPSSQKIQRIPFSLVQADDVIFVPKGEIVPVDGKLISPKATVNQKFLTGESMLTKLQAGDKVFAGSANLHEPIVIHSVCKGLDNTILKLLKTVRTAQLTEHSSSRMDKLIQYFVPSVIAISFASGLGWWLATGSMIAAVNTVTSVLLCACPCALGLAAPLSQALASYSLLGRGVLVKKADKLQSLAGIDTIVFDKTGTLTEPQVETVASTCRTKEAVLQIVASLEYAIKDKHPIAKACVDAYHGRDLLKAEQLEVFSNGVKGLVDGKETIVGHLDLMTNHHLKLNQTLAIKLNQCEQNGLSPLCVIQNNRVIALLGLKHYIKTDVRVTLDTLAKDYKLILLTGDNKAATDNLVKHLPFTKVWSEKNPDQKQAKLAKLNAENHRVAYVGDGINDLKAALDSMVSISILPWTQLASVADLSLKGRLADLPKTIAVAKKLNTNVMQNLWFNLAYNAISIATATGLLIPVIGTAFNPIIFSAMMGLSSICVVLNALRVPGKVSEVMGDVVDNHGLQVSPTLPKEAKSPKPQPTIVAPQQTPQLGKASRPLRLYA